MKKNVKFLQAVLLLLVCGFANAQQQEEKVEQLKEVVVTATKFATEKKNVGKVVYQIKAADISRQTGRTVVELLNEVPGIEINGSSSVQGKNLYYYVRGGRSKQVLILIDGIPVMDPSGISFSYDLNLLNLEQVESIEIIKGAASTLYGSGAATAVINIRLKKASKEKFKANVNLSMGSNQNHSDTSYDVTRFNQSVGLNGVISKVDYLFSFNHTNISGLSEAISENEASKFEDDPYSGTNVLAKIGVKISDNVKVDVFGAHDKITHDFDLGAYSDGDINIYSSEQTRLGISPALKYNKGELKLNASVKKADRYFKSFNTYSNSTDESNYATRSVTADLFNKYSISNKIHIVSGTDFQFHDTDNKTPYGDIPKETGKFNVFDPYIAGVLTDVNGFNFNIGGRLNVHSAYGSHFTYNINPSYNLKLNGADDLKILSSISTAYIVPSLYQLFSSYGNLDLKPEENKTIEGGFEASLLDDALTINGIFFYREEKNSLQFYTDPVTYASNYINDDQGVLYARGIETEVGYAPRKDLKFKLNYTYTKVAEDRAYSVPENKWNAFVNYAISEKGNVSLSYSYVGERNEQDFRPWPAEIYTHDSYQLVNAYFNHKLIDNRLTLYGSVKNLFNEDYMESLGFSTRGRNFNLGLKFYL